MTEYIRFATKRDFDALCELIKRSALGNKEPDVLRVEPVVNPDENTICNHRWQDEAFEYHNCAQPAAVRVVRNHGVEWEDMEPTARPTDVYSEAYCLDCIDRALTEWVDEQVQRMRGTVDEARVDPDDLVTDGGRSLVRNDDDDRSPEAKLEEVREELERVADRDVPISEDFERILAKLDQEGS